MGVRETGVAYCNRCNRDMTSDGITVAMNTSDLADDGTIRSLLFCYRDDTDCANEVATVNVVFLTAIDDNRCAVCSTEVFGIQDALVCNAIGDDGYSHRTLFCYINGHRDSVLAGEVNA